MDRTSVSLSAEEKPDLPDNPADLLKRQVRDQAISAIEQMHLSTAIQRIVEWKDPAPGTRKITG